MVSFLSRMPYFNTRGIKRNVLLMALGDGRISVGSNLNVIYVFCFNL